MNNTSDVQKQLNNLLSTLISNVQTLNNTITTNVQTLNNKIRTSNYNTLNTMKQDKGTHIAFDANNAITLADNITFCTVTSIATELKQ